MVAPPDEKSKGLEMRRAILIHRFMEAYKQTVTIKDNKPVGHARKGEPAVTGTAALTAFAASYMEDGGGLFGASETFLDQAKLTAKTDIRSDEADPHPTTRRGASRLTLL